MRKVSLLLLLVIVLFITLTACSEEKTTNAEQKAKSTAEISVGKSEKSEEELAEGAYESIFVTGDLKALNPYSPDAEEHIGGFVKDLFGTRPHETNSDPSKLFSFEFDKTLKILRVEDVRMFIFTYKIKGFDNVIGYGHFNIPYYVKGGEYYALGTGNEVSPEVSAQMSRLNSVFDEAIKSDADLIGFNNFSTEYNQKHIEELTDFATITGLNLN